MLLKIKRFIRIAYYTTVMYVVTHAIVFTLLTAGLIRMAFNPVSCIRSKERFGLLLFRIVGMRVKTSGLENVEEGRHYLIVANYPSFHAGFTLMMLFPQALIIVHEFMSKVPFLGNYLKHAGVIHARRTGFRRTMREINTRLGTHGSNSTIILPEGKRTPDGQIKQFKRGFIFVLRHSSLDLLPITLRGFYQLKPVNRIYMDPDAEPEVIIHHPVGQAEIKSMSDDELLGMTLSLIQGDYRP